VAIVCTNCGYQGNPVSKTQGSLLVEIALWVLLCVPGIIYTVWRLTSKQIVCPRCGNLRLVPLATPEGQRIAAMQSQPVLGMPPAPAANTIPAQIEHLARLREQGAITEGEFQAQKQRLLNS
jgi:hypothetical protein